MQVIAGKIAELESLIAQEGFDMTLQEETENHFKFTMTLGDFIVMISTPKEAVQVYVVSVFQNRETIFQDWFYDLTFVSRLKELIELYKNS
jgi:hypothetical protein